MRTRTAMVEFFQQVRPWRWAGVPSAMSISAVATVLTEFQRLASVDNQCLLLLRTRPSGCTSFISKKSCRSFLVATFVGNKESVTDAKSSVGIQTPAYIECSQWSFGITISPFLRGTYQTSRKSHFRSCWGSYSPYGTAQGSKNSSSSDAMGSYELLEALQERQEYLAPWPTAHKLDFETSCQSLWYAFPMNIRSSVVDCRLWRSRNNVGVRLHVYFCSLNHQTAGLSGTS